MMLSGDDLTKINPERLAMLWKVERPTDVSAEFTDGSLRVDYDFLKDWTVICALNWVEKPATL
jgi:hypothetical protein